MRTLAALLCLVTAALADDPPEGGDPASDNPAAESAPVEPIVATHVEIAPLEVPLGPNGRIETLAMDPSGRLLIATSSSDVPLREFDRIPADFLRRRPGPGQRRRPGQPLPNRPGQEPARESSEDPGDHADEAEAETKDAGEGNDEAGEKRGEDSNDAEGTETVEQDAPREHVIHVVDPEQGTVLERWPITELSPETLHAAADGSVFVAGTARLARLDASGKTVNIIDFSDIGEFEHPHASGVTTSENYVFLAIGAGFSLRATEDIYRLNRDLTEPTLIVQQQFGCCSHIDMDVCGEELLIAENSRHRVNRFTFDGELLGRWGERDRTSIEGFAACCNPVNFDMVGGADLYTAESGIGRIKRYSPAGELLDVVGYVDTTKFDRGSRLAAQSCYIPIEVGQDARRIYIMDVRANFIRVLQRTEETGLKP